MNGSRPGKDEYAPYYERYVARVPAGDFVAILERQSEETASLLSALSPAKADFRYAPGKWSVKEVVGHLADTERVLCYRALRFARGDQTALPGFDENTYVPKSGHSVRSLGSLIDEFRSVRRATLTLFASLSADAWLRSGTANNHRVSVRALACIIAGHELHHREILATRYLSDSAPTG